MAKNHVSKQQLHRSHKSAKEKAAKFINSLRMLNTREADALADAIAKQMEKADEEVAAATAAIEQSKETRTDSKSADKNFKSALQGVVALFALAEPEQAKELPELANYKEVDLDFYAQQLSDALGTSKKVAPIVELLEAAKAERLDKERAMQVAVTDQIQIRNGKASQVELKMLLLQAEVLIRRTAVPGSPAYDVFRKPRKASTEKPKGKGKGTGSTATPPSANTPAPVTTPPSAAGEGATAVATFSTPVMPAAMVNGVGH